MRKLVILTALLFSGVPCWASFTLTISTLGPVSTSVIISSNPGTGINCGSTNTQCSAIFSTGSIITLTEISDSTTAFAGWTGSQGCFSNQQKCSINFLGNSAVTATFLPMLGISQAGVGIGVVTSTNGIDCAYFNGCAFSQQEQYAFPQGTKIVLTEAPSSSSTFVQWIGDGGCSTASTCTITLNGYEAIIASFTSSGPFPIAVDVLGKGTVISSTGSIRCPPNCVADFNSGTSISFSTMAAPGWFFAGWSNGGCSGLTPCTIKANSMLQGLFGNQSPSAFFYKNQ